MDIIILAIAVLGSSLISVNENHLINKDGYYLSNGCYVVNASQAKPMFKKSFRAGSIKKLFITKDSIVFSEMREKKKISMALSEVTTVESISPKIIGVKTTQRNYFFYVGDSKKVSDIINQHRTN